MVLKMSDVLMTVEQGGFVGHVVGQLEVGVVVTVVGEQEVGNGNVGHECSLEREPE